MNETTELRDLPLYLTTGESAAICQASSRSVSKWFDAGMLRGYRLPPGGSGGDRRILASALIEFLNQQGAETELLVQSAGFRMPAQKETAVDADV